jgi:hypothetical protein
MQCALVTDFAEPYDHWFDLVVTPAHAAAIPAGVTTLRRVSTDGPDKVGQLNFLYDSGWTVPRFGPVSLLAASLRERMRGWGGVALGVGVHTMDDPSSNHLAEVISVVVHDDVTAHGGDGKRLCTLAEAMQTPDAFAVEYLASQTPGRSWSRRILLAGRRALVFDYTSPTDWRSNVGDVQVRYAGSIDISTWSDRARYPALCAIDFVWRYGWTAIDYNVAPGVRHSGLASVIAYRDFVRGIVDYLEEEHL